MARKELVWGPKGHWTERDLLIDLSDWAEVARTFVRWDWSYGGVITLRYHRGSFYEWTGKHYRERDDNYVRGKIKKFLQSSFTAVDPDRIKETAKEVKPTTTMEINILAALKTLPPRGSDWEETVCLDYDFEPPAWLPEVKGDRPEFFGKLIAFPDGLYHPETERLFGRCPEYLNPWSLPYEYQNGAGRPFAWLEIIHDLFGDKKEKGTLLQEIFGCILSGDTDQRKIYVIAGGLDKGRDVVWEAIYELMGEDNVDGPTLASLCEPNGLRPLIGIPLAIIDGNTFDDSADYSTAVERLRKISGEEPVSIKRENETEWTGKLPTRFVVFADEVPEVFAPDGPLADRIVTLELTESGFPEQNLQFSKELKLYLTELFCWAMDGWKRSEETKTKSEDFRSDAERKTLERRSAALWEMIERSPKPPKHNLHARPNDPRLKPTQKFYYKKDQSFLK